MRSHVYGTTLIVQPLFCAWVKTALIHCTAHVLLAWSTLQINVEHQHVML